MDNGKKPAKSGNSMTRQDTERDTDLVHLSMDPADNHGIPNPPVYHASTVIFPTMAALHDSNRDPWSGTRYGRIGTPTSHAFEEAMASLEGGYRAVSVCSGLAAITVTLQALLSAGDHLLIPDTAYAPGRIFADNVLARTGIEVSYYDPLCGADIARHFRDNTRLVLLESPGSMTLEVQDVPAIAKAARENGILTAMDNTWATPLLFRPLEHGVDIAIHAATKYIVGHSDAMLGVIVCNEATWRPVKKYAVEAGICAGPDDLYLGLRGLRSMGVRLRRQEASALEIAGWLEGRDEVSAVLHPALPGHPGHDVWKRDFTGSSGLFSFTLAEKPTQNQLDALLDNMDLFGIGYSWGGHESLVCPPPDMDRIRTATGWNAKTGPVIRLSIGLEDTGDLIASLARGFAAMRAG